MERIKLHDKVFEVSIPSDRIQDAVKKVADQINSEYTDADLPVFLSVLNGSFMFTADLIKNINFQCEISYQYRYKSKSYILNIEYYCICTS